MSDTFRHDEILYQALETDPGILDEESLAGLLKAAVWKRNPMSRKLLRGQRPDFEALERRSLEAFATTRHAGPLAYLMLSGLGGGSARLARVADLGRFWLGEGWDNLHPVVEDETDSYARMSLIQRALPGIVAKTALETAPAVMHERMGPVTLSTILVATGRAKLPVGDPDIPLQALRDAFSDQSDGIEILEQAALAYEHTRICLEDIAKAFGSREVHEAATFREKMLEQVAISCGQATVALRAVAEGIVPRSEDAQVGEGVLPDIATTAPAPSANVVKSRQQAFALMDTIVRFYAQNARSSPVPLGLIALRDLMDSDLNGWIKMTAPEGLEEAGLRLDTLDEQALGAVAKAPRGGAGIDLSQIKTLVSSCAQAIEKAEAEAIAEILPAENSENKAEEDPKSSTMKRMERKNILDKVLEKITKKEAKVDFTPSEQSKLKELINGLIKDGAPPVHLTESDVKEKLSKAFGDITAKCKEIDDGLSQIKSPQVIGEKEQVSPEVMTIDTRKDVRAALRELEKFFAEDEPSSPASTYMHQLNDLVDANFSKIVNTVMVDGKGPIIQLQS